ncbi:MAG: o-succinylbenzoate--CoA ligase [Acidobacteriota bacterium]
MINNECPIRNSSTRYPNKSALLSGPDTISYKELENLVAYAARSLAEHGISSGSRIGIISENSPQYITLFFALLRLGAVVIPINFRFSFTEIERIVSGLGIDLVISDIFIEELKDSGIKRVGPGLPFKEIREKKAGSEKASFKKGSTIILTSGSTGVPKGVLLSSANHLFNAAGSNMNIVLAPDDKWLLLLPLFHVGGIAILFRAFLAGAGVVLPGIEGRGIDEEIDEMGITHVSMVHTQLLDYVSRLENRNKIPSKTVKVVLAGGGAVPESLIKKALDSGVPLYKTYGLTEMGSQVTTTGSIVDRKRISTSGSALNHNKLSISPDGEVLVKGGALFSGYISEGEFIPVETDEHGWFRTGDLGYIDVRGDLFLTGRKDNMFISGGENIFPEEIESELLQIENISEAIVVPVDDRKYGKRPVAFVGLSGGSLSLREIVAELRKKLPGFKIPDKFYRIEKMSRGLLKRSRRELEDRARSADGLFEISD